MVARFILRAYCIVWPIAARVLALGPSGAQSASVGCLSLPRIGGLSMKIGCSPRVKHFQTQFARSRFPGFTWSVSTMTTFLPVATGGSSS